MAKRKTRAVKENFEEFRLSSGILVRVTALPVWLHRKIERRVNEEFEAMEPEVPLKTVKTVDGDETVEDESNPDYVAEKERVDKLRKRQMAELLGDAVCDLAVEVMAEQEEVERLIKRVEKYTGIFPTDPDERRVEFLTSYAIKNTDDYQKLISASTRLMTVSKVEVAKEIESFPGELEGAEAPEADPPGPAAG